MSATYCEISLDSLKVGMAFSAPLYNATTQKLLLPQSYPVFPGFIEECREHHVTKISTIGRIIDNPKYYPDIPIVYISFQVRESIQLYYDSIKILKIQFTDPKNMKLSIFQELISKWMKNGGKNKKSRLYLQIIRHTFVEEKEYFYAHSLDTMLISMGIFSNYKKETSSVEMIQIAMGAILADIGMILLPDNIKFHVGEYSDSMIKQLRTHPVLGFRFLISSLKIPSTFAYPALEHHERIDGSGYPYGIKGENMHENSIIISLADIFTSQIRARSYRSAKELAEILKDFLSTTMPLFQNQSKVYLKAFISYISIYPVTSFILLTTGEVGMVTDTSISTPLKPTLMVVLDKQGQIDFSHKIYYLSDDEFNHIKIKGIYGSDHLKQLNQLFLKPVFDMPTISTEEHSKQKSRKSAGSHETIEQKITVGDDDFQIK
ncbi:MAG: HD-GYP domain-containing protein [Brevinema sp.]